MDADSVALVARIRADLRAAADPARAPQMQAYMKSVMPYLGVRVPEVRRLVRTAAAERPFAHCSALDATVHNLWHGADYREERYAATALCDTRSARALRDPALLALYRDLIVTGAWWDHLDEVAHRVGELLAGWPAVIAPQMRDWSTDDDRWLRRVSIICQLGRKKDTDLELLATVIEANSADRDFFIRKAIGWALREYARSGPDWVRAFVDTHELSPLSRREALKHL